MERIVCPRCSSVKVKKIDDDEYICVTCSNTGSRIDFARNINLREYKKLEKRFSDDKSLFLSIIDDYKKVSDTLDGDDLKLINRKLIMLYEQINSR